MKIYDISLAIGPQLPVWPGDPPFRLERIQSMEAGAHDNVSRLDMGAHTGTHVDAPFHFIQDGRTAESLSLEVLTGPALVVPIPDEVTLISAAVLERAQLPPGEERLLFRTRNSDLWGQGVKEFHTDFVAIPADGAEWLVQYGVKLVGVDYLSVSPYKNSIPTHRTLLQAGVVILEGLDLSAVTPGIYDLVCLPLKLMGSDGAPARAILRK
ncbi:MAG: cyclase family protein [Anaerolineales bacterium]|jgi:arylformamidase